MATTIGIVKSATETILGIGEVSIDNFTFKLFYKWSVSLFVAGSVAVCSSQFFGDPISCETSRDDVYQADDSVDEEVLNAYCWMYSTFDIPPDFKGSCARKTFDRTNLYNTYYQWVSIFLMMQAIVFYLPRCIWLSMEGGLMNFLVKGNQGRVVEDAEAKKEKLLVSFSFTSFPVTNAFLNHQFYDYGYLVYNYYRLPAEERQLPTTVNPMCEVFPKVATCNYVRYGRGGGQEVKNAICILSLNIINDKVFALLWFWHCCLIIAGFNRILTRSAQLLSSRVRYFLMKMMMHRYLNNNRHTKHIQHYILNCSIGDWFVLYQMSKNLNKRFFAEFMSMLSIKVNPDADLCADPEVDITKIGQPGPNGPTAPFSEDFYDEEQSMGTEESPEPETAEAGDLNTLERKRR
ncbi:innexin inx2 [Eurytemora carolleeae]|uniref:innexin inx2 n=1 Tax=Eurytemora carolleeae TaxID=1294199 RepID=UPI000C75B9FA|nr:innexin inx2 [Eurytemora carolleeae]|eukprot:XP_023324723.1 innexin inx2-like [Eurytemora affinis]